MTEEDLPCREASGEPPRDKHSAGGVVRWWRADSCRVPFSSPTCSHKWPLDFAPPLLSVKDLCVEISISRRKARCALLSVAWNVKSAV